MTRYLLLIIAFLFSGITSSLASFNLMQSGEIFIALTCAFISGAIFMLKAMGEL